MWLQDMFSYIWAKLTDCFAWASVGSGYYTSSSTGPMPDTTSPLYPGRPIRPLPKKKLRSRLSPEQAESIVFPQAPPASKPLFFPFNEPSLYMNGVKGDAVPDGLTIREERSPETYGDEIKDEYQFRGIDPESDEEDGIGMLRRYQEQRHSGAPAYRSFVNGGPHAEIAKYPKPSDPQPAPSSADSVDGYDSFENTNNKKKRKIPTSGTLGNHHSSLSADMAQMGISSPRDSEPGPLDGDGGVGQYYGSGSSAIPAGSTGTGISGAGRGRFGRSGTRNISGRSPLGVSTNGSNAVNLARSVPQRRENGSVGGITNKGSVYFRCCDYMERRLNFKHHRISERSRPRDNLCCYCKCCCVTQHAFERSRERQPVRTTIV